ncbi:hypothetical protein ALI22I_32030 [Saccharothrix sp. ALI-22-I]|nr:hypothetical protein ALI22I_32030 [Saccharothrix sp. ALI-22-I]
MTVATALSLLAAPGTAHALADVQSEAATISRGVVESNHAGFTGSGFVNYDNVTGGYIEYAVSAAQAGPHTLVFRYANGTTIDRPLSVTVDGATAGNLSPVSNEITATPGGTGPVGVPNPGAVTTLQTGTDVPWGVAFLPDGSALVSEREKFTLYRLSPDGKRTNVGKVPGAQGTNGEGGVLGVEVSPTFATDGYVFIYHTASGGNQLVRAKLSGNALSGWTTLLGGVPKNRYHNGGRLRFSPDGKHLFISTGDAQNGNNAQNMNNNAGKILRINPDGSIPSDNPFPGKAIWSYGHRNVQGLDFDSKGRLWASEFGNSSQDEVNLIQRGGNFGWPACEGTSGSCGGTVAPKKTWSTSSASPSGLTVINDHVFVATTAGQRIYRLRIDGNSNLVEQQIYFQGSYGRLRTVEVDHDGDIWLTTSTDKDGTAGNDRLLHVDIVYPAGRQLFT